MTEQFYLVRKVWEDLALIRCHNPADASDIADTLGDDQWVRQPERTGPKYHVQEVREIHEMNRLLRAGQPHICVQYDTGCIPAKVPNYSPCIGDTPTLKPTYGEAYLPYDLVVHFKLKDAFLLWVRVDPKHIIRVVEGEFYDREGDPYGGLLDGSLLAPETLANL